MSKAFRYIGGQAWVEMETPQLYLSMGNASQETLIFQREMDAYNNRLSQQRAATVGEFLRRAGLTMPMDIVGKGEQEPVTTACVGERATPALVACLQPDRRVSVDLIGSVPGPGTNAAPAS